MFFVHVVRIVYGVEPRESVYIRFRVTIIADEIVKTTFGLFRRR